MVNRRQLLQSISGLSVLGMSGAKSESTSLIASPPAEGEKPSSGQYDCYSDDWVRTNPDLVVYLPTEPAYAAEANDHLLVDVTPGGDLLAIWAMADQHPPAAGNSVLYRVVAARSRDNGLTWTSPRILAEPTRAGTYTNFGWPVISKSGRIYLFYNFAPGVGEGFINALIRCKYSDDDGHTWIDGQVDIPYQRSKYDHPDPSVLSRCIVWQKPIRDAQDRPVVALTRSTNDYILPASRDKGLKECRCEFIRYDNIDEDPHPRDLKVTYLPEDEDLISVPVTFEPEKSEGYTFCQEPGLVLLPDGRLFAAMRTANGQVWYSVSEDADGRKWRPSEVLRFKDGGDPILNPVAPTPMFRLSNDQYILFMQNHDGYGYGGHGPMDLNSRRPQFFVVGEYRPGAHQPVWFSQPKMIFDTQSVGIFPHYFKWLSMYASLTEHRGKRIFWYTDRKIFVLGRYITDEMLAEMPVPKA